jgi:membrane protease YdiL (CAAX protease family)
MMKKYLPILICLSFLLSEIILKVDATFGFFCYATLITGCLIALARQEELDIYSKLMVVLLILPMMRIAELFVKFDYVWRSFIIYYVLLFLVLTYSSRFKINPGYTKKGLILLPLVIFFGITLGIIGNGFSDKYNYLIFVLPIIVFSEELLFRGMIQNLIREGYGNRASMILPALLYAVFSLNFTIPVIFILFIASLASSAIYHYTRNIFLTISLSLTVQFFLFILPVIGF